VNPDGLPALHFALEHERGELPPVELHWRIHWYERDFAHERLLPRSVHEAGNWQPAPPDQLAALLLFYARDGFVGLRLAADIAAWWDTFGTQVPDGVLDALSTEYPALSRALTAAAETAERTVGLPARQLSRRTGRSSLHERVAMRVARPDPHASRAQLYAEMGLVDWLLAPPGQLRELVRRHLLLPREVRAQQALHAGRSRPATSLGHSARVLGRYGLAVTRLPLPRR
jgi:hypothetical protein